ncbi:PHA/PHB synthase family protein [Sulfitobacter sabulilitoris]|uniref:Alpha/beta fold hydrolase n=1 Tax=Sulfitobacter sabulilitoris TaxID=2562655 RepID=A0A5S3PBY1_9RHOB|nr:alpha/beta fold hydrolase [Sulfitobacter sabulilitoris]TMM51206.1 alpha/beta fold hydrolase [Sulfitobacter sabulilitoris]
MTHNDTRTPDALLHSAIGRVTGGLSPTALATAYLDWAMHLAGSPTKQGDLLAKAQTEALRLMTGGKRSEERNGRDSRFSDPRWNTLPFAAYRDTFLAQQRWWNAATTHLAGVDPKHERIVNFIARQMLDMAAPSNFAITNPTVLSRTWDEHGENLLRGAQNWIQDFNQLIGQRRRPHCEDFCVGRDIAVTPGEVVFRNRLIELIRYTPRSDTVRPEPILIVPAWIMKYYVLDLSPENSLVRYLCEQGFEVFIISWKNPDADDADLTMQDYVDLGVRAAIKKITRGDKDARLHAVGYCLGGTLLSIAAAAMARDGDDRFATLSLLASQVDFSEPGEIGLFINESQVAFLEDIMATQGYLDADQMAGAFRLLRSNDLIWSRVIRHYLLGERTQMNDLMAWNADSTRMPAKMHSEYLRHLFLHNDLAKGMFQVDDAPVALSDIRAPIFCVATTKDHIAPWRSVYRLMLLTDTDVTFVLTNGGHNGGILSEPGHEGRHYFRIHKTEGDAYRSAGAWIETAKAHDGSWWPVWTRWLAEKSGAPVAPRRTNVPHIAAAPGHYVFG